MFAFPFAVRATDVKMASSEIEFAVQMTCQSCVNSVKQALSGVTGVKNVNINLEKEQVTVETVLPASQVQQLIENTGRKAVVKGYGRGEGIDTKNLGAAVAMMSGNSPVIGVVRFLQANERSCVIDGTLDGLSPGPHGLHIHELGDITDGCKSVGKHYNPYSKIHGGRDDIFRHVGDLGNIIANKSGRAAFRFEDKLVKVSDIIGRSLVVTAEEDDLGKGNNERSRIDGNSGDGRLACGIIARSAGLFQNPKKVCVCDGTTLWDEKTKPGGKQPLKK